MSIARTRQKYVLFGSSRSGDSDVPVTTSSQQTREPTAKSSDGLTSTWY